MIIVKRNVVIVEGAVVSWLVRMSPERVVWVRALVGDIVRGCVLFKNMNGLAHEYLQSLFSQRRSVYNLRDSEGKLTLP